LIGHVHRFQHHGAKPLGIVEGAAAVAPFRKYDADAVSTDVTMSARGEVPIADGVGARAAMSKSEVILIQSSGSNATAVSAAKSLASVPNVSTLPGLQRQTADFAAQFAADPSLFPVQPPAAAMEDKEPHAGGHVQHGYHGAVLDDLARPEDPSADGVGVVMREPQASMIPACVNQSAAESAARHLAATFAANPPPISRSRRAAAVTAQSNIDKHVHLEAFGVASSAQYAATVELKCVDIKPSEYDLNFKALVNGYGTGHVCLCIVAYVSGNLNFSAYLPAVDGVPRSKSSSECEDEQVQSDYTAYCNNQFDSVGVRSAGNQGNELFATCRFAKAASIGFYLGEVKPRSHSDGCIYCVQFSNSNMVLPQTLLLFFLHVK